MASRTEGFGWPAVLFAVLAWVLCAVPLAAQGRLRAPAGRLMGPADVAEVGPSAVGVPDTADAVIEQMARSAGVIFAGQVTAVRRPAGLAGSGEDAGDGMVEVDFRVDQAIRLPAPGPVYTLREWSGLWTGNSRRYRVGQRLLVFLYAPDANGFSSPVHGAEGAIPLCGGGVAPGPDDAATGAAGWNVDLRWIQAEVLREQHGLTFPVHAPVSPKPIHGVIPEFGDGQSETGGVRVLSRRLPEPSPLPVPAPVDTEPLAQVVALCQQAMHEEAMGQRDGVR